MVLHLIDSGGVYGIERMLMSLLPKLKQRGYDAALACLSPPKDSSAGISDVFSGSGVRVFCPTFVTDKLGLRAFPYLFKVVKSCDPSIIHLHGYKATIAGGCFAFTLGIPSVATYHAEAKYAPNLAKYVRIETQVLRKIRGIVAVSDPIKKELEHRGVSDGRIRVIPNGIDDFYMVEREPKNYFKNGKRDPIVIFVGRLIEKKNIHVLINAIACLKKKFPRIRLLVAGEGPYKKELVNQVRRLDLIRSVNFLGYVDDIYSLYKMCDCFVLPSKTEGMPIALLEAMTCKLPIIASAVGSVPKMVTHEVDALLIEPDNEEVLYQALKRLINSPSLQRTLGINARKKFLQYYTSDLMADRYKEFYDRILTIR